MAGDYREACRGTSTEGWFVRCGVRVSRHGAVTARAVKDG